MQRRLRRLATNPMLGPVARRAYRGYRSLVPKTLTPLQQKAEDYDRMTVEVACRSLTGTGTCVDAGANKGDLLVQFITASPSSTFLAFEPIPDLVKALRRRCPKADVRALALSDRVGTAEFRYLPDRPALSSLLVRPDREAGEAVQDLQVPVDTLDNVVAGSPRVEFLKVDVEGAELDLFRGARRVLTVDRPVVVFECGGVQNLTDVAAELLRRDYALWTMPEWLADGPVLNGTDGLLAAAEAGEFQFVAAADGAVGPGQGSG
jgi:FkbM family methyltransferase